MSVEEIIYMPLIGEGVSVWRPVSGKKIRTDIYKILPYDYDPSVEEWEFPPGTCVVCEIRRMDVGLVKLAVRKV